MLKLNFWKKEKPLENTAEQFSEEKPKEEGVVLDQKSLDIGSSLGELNQKLDKLSAAMGQCFLALDNKIDAYKDNIVVIEDGITRQVEQHNEIKEKMESYENKIIRLIRNLRYEIEAEIGATSDEGTKHRLGNTVEKINYSLVLELIKEKGPIDTSALEEEVINRKICSKATLFRKLKTLREKGFIQKEDKNGQVFYSVSTGSENKEDSPENLENS